MSEINVAVIVAKMMPVIWAAFWFLAVEETFGTEAAVKLNEDIWIKIAPLAARKKEPVCHRGRGRSRRYGSSVVLSLDYDYRI